MIRNLPDRTKTILIGVGVYVVGAIITTVVFRPGVPPEVHFIGLFQAIPAGLAAASIVLIYRSVRIINWAVVALGAVAAQLFYELYAGRDLLPYGLSLFVGLLTGPLIGAIVGVLFATLFFKHPRLVLTVGTILVTGLIGFIQGSVDSAFHPPGELRTRESVLGPWADCCFRWGNTPIRPIHFIHLGLLVLVGVGLVVFFRKTRVGTAVRAAAENSDRASLLGINVKLLQIGVWTIAGLIAGIGQLGQLAVVQYNEAASFDFVALLLPLAAAVVARMSSMPVAFFTAMGLSLMKNAVQFSAGNWVSLTDLGMLALIMVGLLVQRRRIQARADEGTSWRAVKEIRSTPRELLALRAVSRTRRLIIAIVGLVVLGLPWIVSIGTVRDLHAIWIFALVAVSLVILTGWSGQISLGQYSLVAVGAFVGGNLSSEMGVPFWFAVPIAGLAGAAASVIIGLPALRIRGLFLAVTTFAIAAVTPLLFFDPQFLMRWIPEDVERPRFFFVSFQNDRWMYYLLFGFFILTILAVQQLRKSRAGRVLIALRDNEAGAQSFGVNVVRTKLSAFAISGFIAAVAGALLVHQSLGMERQQFPPFQSILVFIIVVIGGVSSVMGASLGALYLTISTTLFPGVAQLLTGVLGLIVLMAIPGGLTQVVFGTRDAILRVIAMRQHIIVPSLFADYSPEAWEKRLVPLAPAVQSQGIGALAPEQRYRLPSRIFGKATV